MAEKEKGSWLDWLINGEDSKTTNDSMIATCSKCDANVILYKKRTGTIYQFTGMPSVAKGADNGIYLGKCPVCKAWMTNDKGYMDKGINPKSDKKESGYPKAYFLSGDISDMLDYATDAMSKSPDRLIDAAKYLMLAVPIAIGFYTGALELIDHPKGQVLGIIPWILVPVLIWILSYFVFMVVYFPLPYNYNNKKIRYIEKMLSHISHRKYTYLLIGMLIFSFAFIGAFLALTHQAPQDTPKLVQFIIPESQSQTFKEMSLQDTDPLRTIKVFLNSSDDGMYTVYSDNKTYRFNQSLVSAMITFDG